MTTAKTVFEPKDFSSIFYYPEVPTKKGWYVSTWSRLRFLHNGTHDTSFMDFWYWDGRSWYTDASGTNCSKASNQDRNWFGLKNESNSGE